MTLPKMDAEQRARALEKAVLTRRRRAEVKSLLKSGSLTLSDLFDGADSDPTLGGIKVTAALASMPKTGKVTAARIMDECGISENRRVRGLGPKQRAALLNQFS